MGGEYRFYLPPAMIASTQLPVDLSPLLLGPLITTVMMPAFPFSRDIPTPPPPPTLAALAAVKLSFICKRRSIICA